ncbi:MAG TPA: response regulator [Verrucomicrobiae bacterium]
MAKLVVITKGLPAMSHELGDHWTTIGRAHDNTFQIVETSVSGKHCEVRLKDDELTVRDLLSTNGIYVGGKKVIEAVVKAGETFRIGEVELRFDASVPATPGTAFRTKMLVTNAAAATAPKPAPVADAPPSQPDGDPAKKHHVLFVDDSMAFLEMFSELCANLSGRTWETHSATTADRALAILKDHLIDLVVLDIRMPTLDGIQLLGIIQRRHPDVKVAVITGNANETNRTAALANGAELFFEKPVSPESIKVVFNMLNDLISLEHREGFSGALRKVGLQEVIQMECIGCHSSILEIRNQQIRGQIYIETGRIIHASVGTLVGEKAFYRLMSMTGGEFQLKPFIAPPEHTVQGRWESLLMEAAHAFDEETALLPKAAVEGATKPAPAEQSAPAATKGEHEVIGDDIIEVAVYDGKWTPLDGSQK